MAQLDLNRLRNPSYSCLFSDSISCRIRQALFATPSRIKNVLTRLEENLNGEPEYFWEEPGSSNLLTFLYWCKGDSARSEMVAQNNATLERFPNNVAALTMKLRLHIQLHGGEASDVGETFEMLVKMEKEQPVSLQILRCEGEVALALIYIGPTFYGEAVDRYRKLLDRHKDRIEEELSSPQKSQEFVTTLCSWHFHLAMTYNRMMTTNFARLTEKGYSIDDLYKAMRDNLIAVLNSDNSVYKCKAMIELVDAFKHCRQLPTGSDEIVFPYKNCKTNDDFVRAALEEGPRDPYVLERCGRHFRQIASSETDLLEAISILDKCPTKHVAWHHKGLAYIRLGLLSRDGGRGGRVGRGSAPGASWQRGGGGSRDQYREYLMEAKRCHKEASRLAGDACCLYLVDLARACATVGQYDEAENKFAAAERLIVFSSGDVEDSDMSYLYEQWAFMRSKQSTSRPFDVALVRDVMTMYRKSITSALDAGIKSKRLLISLREVVQRQSEANPRLLNLRLEKQILEKSLDHYSDNDQPLVEAAKDSADVELNIRKLVGEIEPKLTGGGRTETSTQDAYTAFLYLTALYKSGKLDMTSEGDTAPGVKSAYEVARYISEYDISRHIRHDRDEFSQQIAVNIPMRNIFRWVVGSDPMSVRGFTSSGPPPGAADADVCSLEDDFDVCILTPSELKARGSVSEKFLLTLQNSLGLKVGLVDGHKSDLFGEEIEHVPQEDYIWEIEEVVRRSRSVVILCVDDDGTTDGRGRGPLTEWLHCVTPILDRLCEIPAAKVCMVTSGVSSSHVEMIRGSEVNKVKKLVLPDDANLSHIDIANLLLRTLLGFSG